MNKRKHILITSIITAITLIISPIIYNSPCFKQNTTQTVYENSERLTKTAQLLNHKNNATIRIMTFNLLAHYTSWGGSEVEPRANEFFKVRDAFLPDIIGLQEMCNEWYYKISTNNSTYQFVTPLTTAFPQKTTSMIFNKNTVILLDSGNKAFSKSNNFKTRRMVWGMFKSKKTSDVFIVINTHFSILKSPKNKQNQAVRWCEAQELYTLTEALFKKYPYPIIIIGDFNTSRKTVNNKTLKNGDYGILLTHYTDAETIAKNKYFCESKSFNNITNDHIFIKGNATVNNLLLLSFKELELLSDHFPLIADIKFKN